MKTTSQSRFINFLTFCFVFSVASPSDIIAMEEIRYRDLRPTSEDILRFKTQGNFQAGAIIEKFVLGGWPEFAEEPRPYPETTLSVVRGRKQNHDWANAFLLRVDIADYLWLTNMVSNGINETLNMGSGPIVISFDRPVCAFGAIYAQAGAHNPHHPELRRRTSFTFYDETGEKIAGFDQMPGHFIVESGFVTDVVDRPIQAVAIDSDVAFAVSELIARPCAIPLG